MPEPRSPWPVRLAEAVYRALRYLYPADFRRRFDRELAQVFREAARAAYCRNGLLGIVHLCLPTLVDLLITATAEQFSETRRGSGDSPRDWLLSGLLLMFV